MHIESIPGEKGKRGSCSYFICTTHKSGRKAKCEARRVSLKAIEQAVIDSLMVHVLTRENLQPIASELTGTLTDRNRDVDVRIAALEDELESVQKSLNNLVDTFERMGYAADLQRRYDQRKGEEARLLAELSTLKSLHVAPSKIADISEALLDEWIQHIRTALKDGDRGVARRALRQFVEKIVVENGTGTLYYTFPLEAELYMPSIRDLDLRVLFSSPSQKLSFELDQSDIAIAIHRNPDKELLQATILALREQGMSYREIAQVVGLHWTRIQQIVKHAND